MAAVPRNPTLLAVARLLRSALARGRRRLVGADGRHLQPLRALAAGTAAVLMLWVALYLATVAVARQRQAHLADALVQALAEPGATPAQRLAWLPALARAAGADVQLSELSGRVLAHAAMPADRMAPDHAWARGLQPATGATHRLIALGGDTWQMDVRAPIDDLWRLHLQASALLGALAVGVGAVSALAARRRSSRLRAAVAATIAQARSLGEAGYVTPGILQVPELQPLALGMDQLHQRMRALFGVHAEQIEALRRQAHMDALTGLPNRRHFLAVMEAVLSSDAAPAGAGLVLLRLDDLQGLNQRLGAAPTDRILKLLAEVMASYPQRNQRCAVGRLAGGEFALMLPTGGLAHETAQSMLQAVRAQLARMDPLARLQAGAVELRPPLGAAQALAMAQAALASNATLAQSNLQAVQASSLAAADARTGAAVGAGAEATADAGDSDADGDAGDEAAWQRRLARAVVQGRVRLGEFPVRTPDGRQLMLDCPLRVQLVPGGAYEPAVRWLAQATRSRLNSAVDERAAMLALAGIAEDGQARCVNVSAAAAVSEEFVDALCRRLTAMPTAASLLWLDLPESLALEQPEVVRALTRRWRPLGAQVALEHCGEGLMRIPGLIDLGLDCVRIDGRFVNGIADERAADAREHLRGLVRVVQSVGLSVTAEGVRQREDLELLWRMGFDAATGPAVQRDTAPA